MKISDSNNKPLSGLGVSKPSEPVIEGSRISAPAVRAAAWDQIQLSNLSAQLTAALCDSPARLAKLAGLSSAVLAGRYQVDASLVSGGIIRDSLLFGGANYL